MHKFKRQYNYVYKITNVINGRIYIGIHSTDILNDYYLGSGVLLKRSKKIFGEHNFKIEVIKFCDSREEALELEELIVDKDFTMREDNYNMISGGGGRDCYSNCKRKGMVLGECLETGEIQMVYSDEIDDITYKNYHRGLKRSDLTRKRISDKAKDKIVCINDRNEVLRLHIDEFHCGEYKGIQSGKKRYYHPETLHKIMIPEKECPPDGYIQGLPDFSESHREKLSESAKNKIFITNGLETRKINKDDIIPDDWYKGKHHKHNATGTCFINNGVKESRIKKDEVVPEGWVKGRIKIECVHCGEYVNPALYGRNHGDKCKEKIL